MKKHRLYTILGIACAVGYSWLFLASRLLESNIGIHLCFIKTVFGIPCPTCGSTRAVLLLTRGDLIGSLLLNPIGLILSIIMVVTPFWLAYDLLTRKDTLFIAYQQFERTVRVKWVAVILIALVAANWIWNFYKPL
jgi:hypothetical protein